MVHQYQNLIGIFPVEICVSFADIHRLQNLINFGELFFQIEATTFPVMWPHSTNLCAFHKFAAFKGANDLVIVHLNFPLSSI